MSTLSHHAYTAEATPAGTALGVTGGQVTADTSRIPHLDATLQCSVENPALLEQLDPRDNARVRITATRSDHTEKQYTPWTEQRRNLLPYPALRTITGWSTPNVSTQAPTPDGVQLNFTNGTKATFLAGPYHTASPGESWAGEFTVTVPLGFPAVTIRGWHVWYNGGAQIGLAGQGDLVTIQPGQTALVTAVRQAPANTTHNRWMLSAASGGDIPAGGRIIVRDAILEHATEAPGYFDGGTNPDGELERTRWLGAAGASASVVESREVTGAVWVPATTRTFDLGIREANPDRAAGTVELRLASDEAILMDYAQLVDDTAPWERQASLRQVCEYVLSKIGATLHPGGPDADVTAFWEVTNLITNPSVRGVLGNWTAGGANGTLTRATGLTGGPVPGVTTYTRTTWTGNSGLGQGGAYGQTGTVAPVVTCRPFTTYRLAVWVRANVAKPVRLSVQIFAEDGSVLNGGLDIDNRTLTANTWTLLEGTFTTPANAAKLGVFTYCQAGTQWVAGNTYDTLGWILHEAVAPWVDGVTLRSITVPFFDAATVDGNYIYEASGAAHVSASTRRPYPIERDPQALIWRAGTSAMEFLHPLLLATGIRLVCDEQRRWWLRDASHVTEGSQTYRYAANIEQARERLSRDQEDWYDAAVYEYVWTDRNGVEQRRTDAFALTTTPTKVVHRQVDAPFPGPGRAEHVVRRAQRRGREVTVTAIPTWDEATDQLLSILLDGTPIQTGLAATVAWSLDEDTVTVTARTTDTPASAWILTPAGEAWTDSPVGESWTEEVI
ncbi:carbohydrate binding domain-containing protein [Microbacterium sp.]|uniref:carbohydrate binding domain-containing protein n=1 Tax=Microbacterium sp. TaxID=51671 RepID=UPI002811D3F4|nr:carbohydrate binding domain-containing protein [Microbacterium sp.]